MDFFSKQFNLVFDHPFHLKGFSSYQNSYFRVVNDVIQCFSLYRPVKGNCTLRIGILPLCMRVDLQRIKYGSGLILDDLFPHYNFLYADTKEEVFRVINDLCKISLNELITFFNDKNSCASYYKFINDNEISRLGGAMSSSDTKIYACLKCGLYNEAINHIIKLEDNNCMRCLSDLEYIRIRKGYKLQLDGASARYIVGLQEMSCPFIVDAEERALLLQRLKKAIQKNDISTINEILENNETLSISFLSKFS